MKDKRYEVQIGIYKIENMVNHKIYIGQSTDIHRRWINHKSAFNQHKIDNYLYNAMYKYGIENFDFSIVEICTRDKLNEREKYWIAYYDSYNPKFGYNLTSGGDNNGIKTRKLTDEEVREIILLLPYKTQTEIAMMYKIDPSEVSRINYGKVYHFDDIDYPICNQEYYISKITKEKNYCIDCGKEIYRSAIRCNSCSGKYKRKIKLNGNKLPTREELKQMIRTESFVKIGSIYNVSDNAIRKWCVSMNLPHKSLEIKTYTDEQWELV